MERQGNGTIDRRTFIKGAAAAAAMATTTTQLLATCPADALAATSGSASASTPASSSAASSTTGSAGSGSASGSVGSIATSTSPASGSASTSADMTYTPGTYTASARGKIGPVTVETTFSEHAIDSVVVTDQKETADIGGNAIARIPQEIVQYQSLAIDAVTGATLTSMAIINAVADAVEQAGGNVDAIKAKEVVIEPGDPETYDCDVLVIGGGASGCVAAAQAADLGAKVVLIEKTAGIRVGGDGFFCVDSQVARDAGCDPIDEEEFFTAWMKDMCWYADANIVRDWLTMTKGTVSFLMDHGCVINKALVDYSGGDSYPGGYGFHQFDISERTTTQQLAEVAGSIEDKGGTILLETVFQDFTLDADGNVTGISAVKSDGTQVTINARSIINAAGGYTGDKPWMAESFDGVEPTKITGADTDMGEVIKRCLDLGAATRGEDAIMVRKSVIVGDASAFTGGDNPTVKGTSFPYLPMVMNISYEGYRYGNEYLTAYNRNYNSKAIMAQGGYGLLAITGPMIDILAAQGSGALGLTKTQGSGYDPDQTMRDEGWGEGLHDMVDSLVDAGTAYRGDTVEELAANAGIDPATLVATYAEYNDACYAGFDSRFFKDPAYLYAQDEGPFYLIKHQTGVFTTLGGVRVNRHMQLVSYDGEARRYNPMANLFAAGSASGGLYSDHYANAEGPCLSYCMTSGRTAAVYAVNNALGTQLDHLSLIEEA